MASKNGEGREAERGSKINGKVYISGSYPCLLSILQTSLSDVLFCAVWPTSSLDIIKYV